MNFDLTREYGSLALRKGYKKVTDSLNRLGSTELFQVGKFLGVVFLFGGFLVSIEVFREIQIPFTRITLRTGRRERDAGATTTP